MSSYNRSRSSNSRCCFLLFIVLLLLIPLRYCSFRCLPSSSFLFLCSLLFSFDLFIMYLFLLLYYLCLLLYLSIQFIHLVMLIIFLLFLLILLILLLILLISLLSLFIFGCLFIITNLSNLPVWFSSSRFHSSITAILIIVSLILRIIILISIFIISNHFPLFCLQSLELSKQQLVMLVNRLNHTRNMRIMLENILDNLWNRHGAVHVFQDFHAEIWIFLLNILDVILPTIAITVIFIFIILLDECLVEFIINQQ